MKKSSAFWRAVLLAVIVELLYRGLSGVVGGVGPDGQGNGVAFILFFLHFPATMASFLIFRDAADKLWSPLSIGASLVVFTLIFWGIIAGWRWIIRGREPLDK